MSSSYFTEVDLVAQIQFQMLPTFLQNLSSEMNYFDGAFCKKFKLLIDRFSPFPRLT